MAERGIGRGLAAILSATPRPDGDDLRRVPLELIVANPRQPRQSFDESALVALSESLKASGVLQPVLVRPLAGGRYELIAGERRWRAAQIAGLKDIPALVSAHDDAASLELALVENMAREDLNPVEEARACVALVEELGLTREDVGRRVGRSRSAVSNLTRLLDLPDEALALIEAGDLSEGHGRALLLASDHDDRRRLARDAAAEGWSVRELERRARPGTVKPRAVSPLAGEQADPDAAAAVASLGEALELALGAEVRVTASATGFRAELRFSSLDEGLEAAARLRRPRAA